MNSTLEHASMAASDRQMSRDRRAYRDLIVKAAERGGLATLSADDMDRLVAAAKGIGLPDHHNFADDVQRIRDEPECLEAVRQAEIDLSAIPTVAESQAEIDDCDNVIREQLEKVLLAYKREQLAFIQQRRDAEKTLREAQGRLALVYSGRPHLKADEG